MIVELDETDGVVLLRLETRCDGPDYSAPAFVDEIIELAMTVCSLFFSTMVDAQKPHTPDIRVTPLVLDIRTDTFVKVGVVG